MRKSIAVVSGVLCYVSAVIYVAPVQADDTEVYVKHSTNRVRPNILMILDNSGSMGENSVSGAPMPYEPDTSYSGSFNAHHLYWTEDSSIPSSDVNVRFHGNLYKCKTGQDSIAQYGLYTGKHLTWFEDSAQPDKSRWGELTYEGSQASYVECEADAGIHGKEDQGDKHPANGSHGPWKGASQALDWSDHPRHYTLYSGNYLNYRANPPTHTVPRYQVMLQVVEELARRLHSVNLGLMWFRSGGGHVASTLKNVDVTANREDFLSELHRTVYWTSTPLSRTLHEAYAYFAGKPALYEANRGVDDAFVSQNPRVYRSPIEHECQRNYAVMMTDGWPNESYDVNDYIPTLPGFANATGNTACTLRERAHPDKPYGICLDDLADYMNSPDVVDISPAVEGNQFVNTSTIGFLGGDETLLTKTAEKGGGQYYRADNADELASAFNNIILKAVKDGDTFVSPAVSVNSFNNLLNRNLLYYSMFTPETTARWRGNVKKYRLAFDANDKPFVTDAKASNAPVIDTETGAFVSTAQSYWGAEEDGNNVLKGGVRTRISDNIDQRKVWTNMGVDDALSHHSNNVTKDNSRISRAMLQASNDSHRERLLNWLRGEDIDDVDVDGDRTDSRRPVGDPLHSQPLAVQYGGTESDPELIIFFTTNDGFLHAINERTGEEIFAFTPACELSKTRARYENRAEGIRTYGLDGSITVEVIDKHKLGVIEPEKGDRVYLYFGMRRGGNTYYALDVTHANDQSPNAEMLWTINEEDNCITGDGFIAGGYSSRDFKQLGQTWSKPVVGKIKLGGTEKRVVIFAGGYDTNQDDNSGYDSIGNAIYIVDAMTGERIWWASAEQGADLQLSNMRYSIPSKVASYDINGDGLLDRLYVGDMGGQLWRFDISSENTGVSSLVSGGRIAVLSGADDADKRRFYYPPDVTLIADPGRSYLALVFGSGYRAHPLDETVNDHIYMVRDSYPFRKPDQYSTITLADLYDATDNKIGEGDSATRTDHREQLHEKSGWYIRLETGEKVLSRPLLIEGVAMLSSYLPKSTEQADPCLASGSGLGFAYYMNISDATPHFDNNNDQSMTKGDRRQPLKGGGIPPSPSYIVAENDGDVSTAVLFGKEVGKNPSEELTIRAYWYEQN